MRRSTLLAEIDWRLKQRGTKELTALLEVFFADDKENDFIDWPLDELQSLVIFLKQDEQLVMDFFLKMPSISKKEFRTMINK